MENQAVNGVLDLSTCRATTGSLILPASIGVTNHANGNSVIREGMKAPTAKVDNGSSKVPPSEWDFNKVHGFNPPKSVGARMVVELYKSQLSDVLEIAKETRDSQKWVSNVGRLICLGSACFKGEQFEHWSEDDKPKVGEWITYKVNSGPVTKFRGIDIVVMYDDAINMIIEDPEHVSRD